MLRGAVAITLNLLVMSVNASDVKASLDVDELINEFNDNKLLNKQIERVNSNALKSMPANYQVIERPIVDSNLAATALQGLVESASAASQIVTTKNHGKMTQAQYATGIADETMAMARYNTLEQLGINPNISGYIFVSESMPDSLIRAYSRDATRLGMSLVFKGFVDKGSIENKFLTLSKKFHTKRNAMSIQADTRLYDAFNVINVPSIIVTDIASMDMCNENGPYIEFDYQQKTLGFNACNTAAEDRYCKISGSVFTDWALKEMASKGCSLASNFLDKTQEDPAQNQNRIDNKIWESYINAYQAEEKELTEYEKEVFQMMQGDFK